MNAVISYLLSPTCEWVVSTLVHKPATATFTNTHQDGEQQELAAAQTVEAQGEDSQDLHHAIDHVLDIRLS